MSLYDIFQLALAGACLGLAAYCHILSSRLKKLNDLETGLGGAIAVMTAEIARLEKGIGAARTEAMEATRALQAEVERAKGERAFWSLQQSISSAKTGPLRRRKRGARHIAKTSESEVCDDSL